MPGYKVETLIPPGFWKGEPLDYLSDSFDRKFVYLRLSVTDRCNFRCIYCLPNGYQGPIAPEPELSIEETRRLVLAFSKLGVSKVRLTGGEPTVRRDIVELVQTVAATPGIKKVGITTNGYRLKELAYPLKNAGVTSLNVSVDSLNQDRFKEITGTPRFSDVTQGLDHALSLGFESVKINAVLLRGTNEDELSQFIAWVKERPVSIRFIELMRTGKNTELFERSHLSGGVVQFELLKSGWKPVERKSDDGPALVYQHANYAGTIGVIAPYSKDFCKTCNRLRVSSRGALRLCLFGEGDASLRQHLGSDHSQDELIQMIKKLVLEKPVSHFLHEGKYGNTWNLSAIGG